MAAKTQEMVEEKIKEAEFASLAELDNFGGNDGESNTEYVMKLEKTKKTYLTLAMNMVAKEK